MAKFLILMFVSLYSSALMAATAVVQTATGNVTAAIGTNAPTIITKDSALESGMTITTGDNSNVVMKFEDGQVVVLNANTTFKINRYTFNAAQPQNGNAFFSLVKGALRSISGMIGKHNNSGFRLHTPVATIGIRGTDFMAATGSPLYLSVGQGVVSATNGAGTGVFFAGQVGFVGSMTAAPLSIVTSQLPASVASSFGQLGGIPVGGAPGAANSSSMSNTGYGNTATGSTSSTTSTASTGSTSTGTGTASSTTAGTTAGTTGTAAGGAAATGAAVGSLSTVAVVGSVAAAAGLVAVATNNNTTAATTTVTVTAP